MQSDSLVRPLEARTLEAVSLSLEVSGPASLSPSLEQPSVSAAKHQTVWLLFMWGLAVQAF